MKCSAWLLLGGLVLIGGGCAATLVPRAPEIAARVTHLTPREEMNLRVFETAWRRVDGSFYDAKFHGVDWPAAATKYGPQAVAAADDEALYKVLNTMLAELKDAHTSAASPKAVIDQKDAPQARIGIAFGKIEGRWMVLAVHPDGPASRGGVKFGWIYVGRDGQPADDKMEFNLHDGDAHVYEFLDEHDAVQRIPLVARSLREGKWLTTKVLEGGVVYLRFDGFDREARRWLSEQLKAHRDAPAIIVDLRQNPGGEAFSLEITLGEFFPHNVAWGRFSTRGGKWRDYDSWQWAPARYGGKVALLTSEATASSAEIFAHVLQHQGRAILVGRPTAGAVIGSYVFKLPDGGTVQIGALDYHGLDDKPLEGFGVKPDVPVETAFAALEDFRAGRDGDIVAALAALKNPRATSPPADGRVQ